MRILSTLIIIFTIALISLFGIYRWQIQQADKEQVLSKLQLAENFLHRSKPQEALEILTTIPDGLSANEEKSRIGLLVSSQTLLQDDKALADLYELHPDAFVDNETASLAVANFFLSNNLMNNYHQLRAQWKNQQNNLSGWFFLDVEELLRQGNRPEALALLSSRSFRGKTETQRLLHLASLHLIEDPQLSLKYLTEASIIDPRNHDFNTFKASLLESSGKGEMALAEYFEAIHKNSSDPYLREQLAEFYLRSSQYPEAVQVLKDTLSSPTLESIWLKALFWSKVISPFNLNGELEKESPPQGNLFPLITYLQKIPQKSFWNEYAFAHLPHKDEYLKKYQELFWLHLLNELKSGNEKGARQLLQQNPFQAISFAPKLEKSLLTILNFRIDSNDDSQNQSYFLSFNRPDIENGNQFLDLLSNLSDLSSIELSKAIPKELHSCLLSDEASTLPFLAQGWKEAALQLHHLDVLPNTFPSWIAYELTQALYDNRSPAIALEFALKQPSSPKLSLFAGELALALNRIEIAAQVLSTIYNRNDQIGRQSALLLGKLLVDENHPQAAKEILQAQPGLENEIAAQEILARIAIQENQPKIAYAIYLKIVKHSPEAKSFLALKAFAEKDWSMAKKLTEELITIHPESSVLKENLQKIFEEERKQQRAR